MDSLVGTYADEWTSVVKDPERRKQFRQFVNTNERVLGSELIAERSQKRPADWAKGEVVHWSEDAFSEHLHRFWSCPNGYLSNSNASITVVVEKGGQ